MHQVPLYKLSLRAGGCGLGQKRTCLFLKQSRVGCRERVGAWGVAVQAAAEGQYGGGSVTGVGGLRQEQVYKLWTRAGAAATLGCTHGASTNAAACLGGRECGLWMCQCTGQAGWQIPQWAIPGLCTLHAGHGKMVDWRLNYACMHAQQQLTPWPA